MIVKPILPTFPLVLVFESSVNSYDSQTLQIKKEGSKQFESSVNSYDSQTIEKFFHSAVSLRVV